MNRFLLTQIVRIVTVTFLATAGYGQIVISSSQPQDFGTTDTKLPGFHAAPSVKAVADGDITRVLTVAVADFDKKGGPDAVTVQADGMLNVLYNDEGNLGRMYNNNSAMALSPNVVYIEAADLNGDGSPDIVAMDTKNSAFLVFMNNGNGTFANAAIVSVLPASGARLVSGGLTVADVNGDGNPDVVTVAQLSSSGSTIFSQQTFLGIGNGTFQAPTGTDTTLSGSFYLTPGRSLSIADMNRDGKPDLVLQIKESSPAEAVVLGVSFGNGDGVFQNIPATGPTVGAATQPASNLTVADVNGDSIPDAVFLTYSNQVHVVLGQADGSLQSPSAVLSNMSGAVLLTLGDVNKDDKLDLIIFGSGQLGVFAGNGDGTFQAAGQQYTGGYGIHQQPAPADFDGDGDLDIAWLDYTNGRIGLYSGNGDGTFAAASPVRPADTGNTEWAGNIQVITAGDFNGDGKKDVLAYDWPHASAGGPADLYMGINDGTGKFFFQLALPKGRLQELAEHYGALIIEATTADFNGDGRPDVIFRTQPGLAVLLAQRDGTLSPTPIDVTFPVSVGCLPFPYLTAGDVNGDGFQDIVAGYIQNTNCAPSASTPSGFFVLLGDGKGGFNATFTPFGNALYFVRVADLNGDRKLDMVVANAVSGSGFNLYAIPGNGDGTFDTGAATIPIRGQYIGNILIGDYNGDGKQDLALSTSGRADSDGSTVPGTEGVLLMPGHGDLTFGDPTTVLQGMRSIWNGTAFGDLNGDGKPELVFSTYTQAETYMPQFGMIVLPNKGDGKFGPASSELMPLGVSGRNAVAFVADFNGDGTPDVLLGSGLSSPLFLNRGRVEMSQR